MRTLIILIFIILAALITGYLDKVDLDRGVHLSAVPMLFCVPTSARRTKRGQAQIEELYADEPFARPTKSAAYHAASCSVRVLELQAQRGDHVDSTLVEQLDLSLRAAGYMDLAARTKALL